MKKNCRHLLLLLFALNATMSLGKMPSPPELERGLWLISKTSNLDQILLPKGNHPDCYAGSPGNEKPVFCETWVKVSRAWGFLKQNLEHYYAQITADETPLLFDVHFVNKLHYALIDDDVRSTKETTITADLDSITLERIDDLVALYSEIDKKRRFGNTIFKMSFFIGSHKQRLGIDLDLESMKHIVQMHIADKQNQAPCGYPVNPSTSLTLNDIRRISSYLQQNKKLKRALASSGQHLLEKEYHPESWCRLIASSGPKAQMPVAESFWGADFTPLENITSIIDYKTLDESLQKHWLEQWHNELVKAEDSEDIIRIVADYSYIMMVIHPYMDGNKRTHRLLVNYILMSYGLAPLWIEFFSPVPLTMTEWRQIIKNAQKKGEWAIHKRDELDQNPTYRDEL